MRDASSLVSCSGKRRGLAEAPTGRKVLLPEARRARCRSGNRLCYEGKRRGQRPDVFVAFRAAERFPKAFGIGRGEAEAGPGCREWQSVKAAVETLSPLTAGSD